MARNRATAKTTHRTLARPPRRPLVVTADDRLLDELLQVAAAAGAELQVATDPAAARGHYATAPLVLVGADQAQDCLRARLPRRPDVVVVCSELAPHPDRDSTTDSPPPRGSSNLADGADRSLSGIGSSDPWELAGQLGASQVALLPAAAPWLVDRLAGCHRRGAPAPVVGVLGGRGGAGASVLAAGLAVTAANRGRQVLLVDGDPLGGGLDLVLGWEDDPGPRWPELTGSGDQCDASGLVSALPGRGDLALLSFDRNDLSVVPPEAMTSVLQAGRHVRDLVVVDLPRQPDPAAVVALQAADVALVVVPAEVRAATAAAKVTATATAHCADVRLVVRGPAPGRLTAEEIGRALGLPVAGTIRPEQGLPATLEGGLPPTASGRGPLAVLCARLVDEFCAAVPAAAAAAAA